MDMQLLNQICSIKTRVAEQSASIKRAINEIKNITHSEGIFLEESELNELGKMVDFLENLSSDIRYRERDYTRELLKEVN